jgi:hypothetical protein
MDKTLESLEPDAEEVIVSRALQIAHFTGLSVCIREKSLLLCGEYGASVFCIPHTEDTLEDLDKLFSSWIQLAQYITCSTTQ